MRSLIIGGTGFVGASLAELCFESGDEVVVTGREDGFTQIWVAPLSTAEQCGAPVAAQAHRLKFEADAFTARLGANAEFDPKQQLRVTYSSTVAPGSSEPLDGATSTQAGSEEKAHDFNSLDSFLKANCTSLTVSESEA